MLLRRLARGNAFITYLPQDGTYKLHHLMQESLQQAFARLPRQRQTEYLSRAGVWQLEHGASVLAARLFYKAGDFHGLMRAVESGQGAELSAEHKTEMLAWFRDCPDEVRSAYPVAMLVYARRLFTFHMPVECKQTLDGLLQRLNTNTTLSETEKNNLLGEVEIVQSFLKFNNIQAMSVCHRRACALMNRPTTAVSPTAVWGYGSPSVLVSYYRLPGTLDEEVAAMKECMPFWYRLNPNQGSGSEHVMEGEAFLMRFNFVDAEICQYRALQDAECAGQLCMVLAAHFLRLRAELLQGDMSGVEPTLRALRERVLAQKEYVLLHSVDMCEAWLYALLGQPHSAAEWLDEGRLEDTRLLFPSVPFLHTVYGQLLLAQGRFTRLIAREESERQLCRIYPMLLCEIYLDIQLAGALERIGKHGEALEHLSRALDAAMPDRLFLPFVENQEYIADLLAELKNGPWVAQITLLAEQCARWRMASQRIRHSAFGQALPCSLTEKERLIARLAAEGYTNTGADGAQSVVSGTLNGSGADSGGEVIVVQEEPTSTGTGYDTDGQFSFTVYNNSDYDIYSLHMGILDAGSDHDIDVLPQILPANSSTTITGQASMGDWIQTDWTIYVTDVDGDTSASYDTFNPWTVSYVDIYWQGDSYVCEFTY